MIKKLFVALVMSSVIFLTAELYGQEKVLETYMATVSKTTVLPINNEINSLVNTTNSYFKNPITLFFKTGKILKGHLLQNPSDNPEENTDVLFVEINGRYEIVKFDELFYFSMDNSLVDTIRGRIVSNDLKRRLEEGLFRTLSNNPSWQGYVVYYYGTEVARAYPATRKKAIDEHIKMMRFDANRITHITGPDCGETFVIEMWAGDFPPELECPR